MHLTEIVASVIMYSRGIYKYPWIRMFKRIPIVQKEVKKA